MKSGGSANFFPRLFARNEGNLFVMKANPSGKFLSFILLSITLALNLCAHAASKPPNIVIILADDLGYGDLGCYGHPTIRTPNLDRMAAEGMRFTDFYVAACVCTPSRAALLTGRLPIRSGMAGSEKRRVIFAKDTGGLPLEEITIARALKTKDYATACIGKWHLDGGTGNSLPTRHGFDHYYGLRWSNDMEPAEQIPKGASGSLNPDLKWFNCALLRDEKIIEQPADLSTLTKRYTAEALQFIRENRKKLFSCTSRTRIPTCRSSLRRNSRERARVGGLATWWRKLTGAWARF